MDNILTKVVRKKYIEKDSCDIAFLKPVVSLDSDGTLKDFYSDQRRKTTFPESGEIFWWNVPFGVEENFWFWITAQQRPSDKACQFSVDGASKVGEECCMLNLPDNTFEAVVEHLNEEGLEGLDSPNVYLRFLDKENEYLYLYLEKLQKKDKEGISVWFCNDILRDHISVYAIDEADILSIKDEDRKRAFLRPGANLSCKGTVNVQSSDEILKSLLKRVRELDSSFVEALNVTHKLYESYRQKILPFKEQETEAYRSRLESLFHNIEKNQEYHHELLQIHYDRNSETLKDLCRREVEEELQRRKEDFEKELAQKRNDMESALSQHKEALENEVSDLQKEKNEIEVTIKAQQENLEQQVAIFDEKIKTVVSDAFGVVAESSIYKLLLGRDSRRQTPNSNANFEIRLPEKDHNSSSMSLENFRNDVKDLLQTNCAFGDSNTCEAIAGAIAFLTARRLPVFWGTGAISAMEALGSFLCGGAVIWHSVSAATYKTQDIFGQLTGDGNFIPSPSNLQTLLQKAEKCEHLVLVALEGINRSPVEAYLPFLLAAYRNKRIKIPMWHGEDITWPSNVILTASFVEGESTFSIPTFLAKENLVMLPTELNGTPQEDIKYRDVLLDEWLDLSMRVKEKALDQQLQFLNKRLNLGLAAGIEKDWHTKSLKFFWNSKERA